MAVIECLRRHAIDDQGQPIFVVKGGVAIEFLLGLNARATKDLDSSVRTDAASIENKLRDALAAGWDGFEFRLESWRPILETGAFRSEIKVSYRGRPFSTVIFEAAAAEGLAGQEHQIVKNPILDPAQLGLMSIPYFPLVTIAYMIGQKFHACTDHSIEGHENDRARDLIDILLIKELITVEEHADVRLACKEIFALRNRHPWPPTVTVLPSWPQIYANELERLPDFEPTDVHVAADEVNKFIETIAAVSS